MANKLSWEKLLIYSWTILWVTSGRFCRKSGTLTLTLIESLLKLIEWRAECPLKLAEWGDFSFVNPTPTHTLSGPSCEWRVTLRVSGGSL